MRYAKAWGGLGGAMLVCSLLLACVMQPLVKPIPTTVVAVDPGALEGHVRMLSQTLHPRSHEHPANLNAAADYVLAQLRATGATTEVQSFEAAGNTYRNLIARFGPEHGPLMVVGAHYDSCADTPGADDNAIP
jgi:hypothetical protein